jgi:hypothetical protein
MKAMIFLLLLAASGLGVWAWWEHSERRRLERELVSVSGERDRFAKTAREKTGLKLGMEMKDDGPRGLSDLGIPLEEEGPAQEDAAPKGKAPGEKESSSPNMAKMLKDPAMKELLRAQAGAQLELAYRDLFDLMGLDESKREAVLAILKQRQGAQTDLGLSVFDTQLPDDERKAAAAKLAESVKEAEAKLKETLGADYAQFERFERSAPEREQIRMFHSMLKDKGLVMDEATETKLMDAMFNERQAFKFDHDLSDMTKVSPDNLSEASVDRFLEQNAVLQQQVLTKVKGILSAEQYALFVKNQENQQQMAQIGIEWLRQITGNRGDGGKD